MAPKTAGNPQIASTDGDPDHPLPGVIVEVAGPARAMAVEAVAATAADEAELSAMGVWVQGRKEADAVAEKRMPQILAGRAADQAATVAAATTSTDMAMAKTATEGVVETALLAQEERSQGSKEVIAAAEE
jgi:hypothetical protein